MRADLDNPVFQFEVRAREWFEARLWPEGPVCPHCGATGEVGVKRGVVKMEGPKCRPGLYQCKACREQFTVTVGTVMERSKIGLHIWLKAMYLLGASKKGMSTHQLHRMLGVSLKSTWFLMHRIREAMREPYFGKLGTGGPVQADETYVGKTTMRNGEWYKRGYVVKEKVLTLVADGKARSFHVPEVNAKTLRPILNEQIDKSARLYTDEGKWYVSLGREFEGGHYTVNHSIKEYVRGGATVNACENYYSILKRGLNGVYQHVSPKHLKRYVGEFDMRYNNRDLTDMERVEKIATGVKGKRLTYRRTDGGKSDEALHGA